jgi:uncharacterized membrane protein
MKNPGLIIGSGLILTIISGGVGTYLIQPIIISNISFGANNWIVSWFLSGIAGYVIATIVWAIIVAIIMMLVFKDRNTNNYSFN